MRHISKYFPILITLFIVAIGVLSYFIQLPFMNLMELQTIDLRFMARGKKIPGPTVVMAVIDEKSVEEEGRWVWPRSKIADLITKISDAGARVIALDIVFSEPENTQAQVSVQDIYQKLKDNSALDRKTAVYLEQLLKASDNDAILSEAIRNSKAKVVLGYFFHERIKGIERLDENKIKFQEALIQNSRIKMVHYSSEKAFDITFLPVDLPEASIPVLTNSSKYCGFFNMKQDNDGVLRWIPAMLSFNKGLYANLSLQALSAYWSQPITIEVADFGVERLAIGDHLIPTGEMGEITINYRGGEKMFPHISATDILHDRVAKEQLKDKIVLIGATAVGIYDLRVTPFANEFPGVEAHANLIDMVLSQDFLLFPARAAYIAFAAMLIAGLFLTFIIHRVNALMGAMAAGLVISAYVYICIYMFNSKGIVLNLIYPSTVILLVYIVISAYRYLVEEGQKRFIKGAFSTYVSPAVVDQLIKSPEKLDLGGEEREITAFFSDIEGFTTISEKLTPKALVELLNEFLTEMADIIMANLGTVDKFEGDAIIAMFGAPVALENHAEAACNACIHMQKRLEALREKWQQEKQLTIRMRIGLCSGLAVVGNMGSKSRLDYTMMGDTVNTAARLEGVNKVYGTYIMISETTYEQVKEKVIVRELDAVNVVGKKKPVKIYQLIGHPGEISQESLQMVDFYHKGLNAYREQKWDLAIGYFKNALLVVADDKPSKVMIDRCEEFKESPPGEGWNGAHVLKSK